MTLEGTSLHAFQKSIASLGQTMNSCAPMFYSYFLVLKEQGFTPDQAMHMVTQMQTFILSQGEQR